VSARVAYSTRRPAQPASRTWPQAERAGA